MKKAKQPDKVDWTRKIKVKEKVVQKEEQNDSDPVNWVSPFSSLEDYDVFAKHNMLSMLIVPSV